MTGPDDHPLVIDYGTAPGRAFPIAHVPADLFSEAARGAFLRGARTVLAAEATPETIERARARMASITASDGTITVRLPAIFGQWVALMIDSVEAAIR